MFVEIQPFFLPVSLHCKINFACIHILPINSSKSVSQNRSRLLKVSKLLKLFISCFRFRAQSHSKNMKQDEILVFFCVFIPVCYCLRPLLFIHGLTSSHTRFDIYESFLKKDFPSLKVVSLDAFNWHESEQPLGLQIQVFSDMVRNITDQYGDVTLVGHSQGALISRAILQTILAFIPWFLWQHQVMYFQVTHFRV